MSGELPCSTAAPCRALVLNPDHAVAFCCTAVYPCLLNMFLSESKCACAVDALLHAWTLTAYVPFLSLTVPLYTAIPACGLDCSENGVATVKFSCCIVITRYWLIVWFAGAGVRVVLVPALGVGVGDDV